MCPTTHRYKLPRRVWKNKPPANCECPRCTASFCHQRPRLIKWVLFNPSHAEEHDENINDATIDKVNMFSRRCGYEQFKVFNLIPKREPKANNIKEINDSDDDNAEKFERLFGFPFPGENIFQNGNPQYEAMKELQGDAPVVIAWGKLVQDKAPWASSHGMKYIQNVFENQQPPLFYLGELTVGKHPRHPSRQTDKAAFKKYDDFMEYMDNFVGVNYRW